MTSNQIIIQITTLNTCIPQCYYEIRCDNQYFVSQLCSNIGTWNEIVLLQTINSGINISFYHAEQCIGYAFIDPKIYATSDFVSLKDLWFKLDSLGLFFKTRIEFLFLDEKRDDINKNKVISENIQNDEPIKFNELTIRNDKKSMINRIIDYFKNLIKNI